MRQSALESERPEIREPNRGIEFPSGDKTTKMLIVDDDPQILRLVQKMLMPRKVNVLLAPRPSAAIRICEEQKVDLLIADIRLPGGISGLEMTQCARLHHPALKCLFISGKSEPRICDPALDDFVAKPFRNVELLGCVWKVLRGNLPTPRIDIAR